MVAVAAGCVCPRQPGIGRTGAKLGAGNGPGPDYHLVYGTHRAQPEPDTGAGRNGAAGGPRQQRGRRPEPLGHVRQSGPTTEWHLHGRLEQRFHCRRPSGPRLLRIRRGSATVRRAGGSDGATVAPVSVGARAELAYVSDRSGHDRRPRFRQSGDASGVTGQAAIGCCERGGEFPVSKVTQASRDRGGCVPGGLGGPTPPGNYHHSRGFLLGRLRWSAAGHGDGDRLG